MFSNGHVSELLAAMCILRRTCFEFSPPSSDYPTLDGQVMADRIISALVNLDEGKLTSVMEDLLIARDNMTDRVGGMILSVVIDLLEKCTAANTG